MLLGKTIMLQFLLGAMNLLLAHNTPETHCDSGNTGEERRVIGSLVTAQSIGAVPFAVWTDNRMLVEDAAIKQVKNITAQDRGKDHKAPVLGKATNAECVGN